MKRFVFAASLAALVSASLCDLRAQSPRVEVTMRDGRVTVIARDAALSEVLAEWARVGQTKIVNAEKMNGARVTLQIVNSGEREALDILLRSAAGYIAAPRPIDHPGPTAYDRITILASSRAPTATAVAAYVEPAAQAFGRPAYSRGEDAYGGGAQHAAPPPPPSPSAVMPTSAVVPEADEAVEPYVPGSMEGAQPIPSQQPNVSPLPGLHPQLEAAQPRGLDMAQLMKLKEAAAERAGPTTASRPGIIQPPAPGGRGGGQ